MRTSSGTAILWVPARSGIGVSNLRHHHGESFGDVCVSDLRLSGLAEGVHDQYMSGLECRKSRAERTVPYSCSKLVLNPIL